MINQIHRIPKYWLFLVLATTVVACHSFQKEDQTSELISNPEYGVWQQQDEQPIQFEEVQRYGAEMEPDEAILSEITHIFTDDSLNVYILDNESNKLISFYPDGELRWTAGEKGRGPGDFENPRSMVWDGETDIYISNIYDTRIDQFDISGRYVKTLPLSETFENTPFGLTIIGLIENHLLIFAGMDAEFAGTFFLLDPKNPSEPLRSFVISLTGDVEVPPGMHEFSTVSIIDDQIVIPDLKRYALYFYNPDSIKTRSVVRDFNYIVRPGFFDNGTDRYIGTFSKINDVLKLSTDYYVTSAYWVKGIKDPDEVLQKFITGVAKGMEYHSTIDLYDKDWNLLYSLESDKNINPEIGQPAHVDQRGDLYTFSFVPYPHVKRLKVTVDK